jgi:EmrB/QacA subfamily drug resistance transporter
MKRPQVTALIIASALFMENIDTTVIATALPTIARSIGTDPIHLKLALTAYLLSLATFIPISGWAADRFGARLVFRVAIAVFMAGSILCSLATSLEGFVLARIVQGAGGAMMTPVGRLVLLRTTPKKEFLSAMAWFTVPALIGPLIGPPLGGFIVTYFDWEWIFWINVPVGIVGILLVGVFVPEVREETPAPLDTVGFVLTGIGLSGIVFGLSVIGQPLLPLSASLAMTGVGAVSLGLYLLHARRKAHPLLDLGLFRLPTFRVSAVGGSLFRIGVGAIPFLLPLTLQLGLGKTPLEAGSLVFFAAGGALLMKVTSQPIVRRFGFRTTLIWNGVLSAAAIGGMALFAYDASAILIVSVLLVGGFFRSLQFTCLNAIAYADVTSERMSRATSLYSVVQQVSLAAGVAVGAALLEVQRAWYGGEAILASYFVPAFATVAAFAAVAIVFYARLPEDAGAEMANRPTRGKRAAAATTPAHGTAAE